jgi:nucleoside-diphosphate-sugar epimerase
LPSNQSPLGALPSRFKRERLLIIGCGDVGQRVVRAQRHVRVVALTSSPSRVAGLRAQGVTPVVGNLDDAASLQRLAGWATRVLHLAPPPLQGHTDPRTLALTRLLMRRSAPLSVVYGSTTGVYGDCAGDWVAESRAVNPTTPRAQRRVDAEARVRHLGRLRSSAVRVSVLRIPGIYAPDREGGTPRERLLRGTPVLVAQDDVFTNHIHANDLARACQLALWRGKAQRIYNVNDDSQLRMGDYFDLAAGLYGLAQPPRISRAQAQTELPAMQLSFMSESRRMVNTRMKRELRLQLRYPDVMDGLRSPTDLSI